MTSGGAEELFSYERTEPKPGSREISSLQKMLSPAAKQRLPRTGAPEVLPGAQAAPARTAGSSRDSQGPLALSAAYGLPSSTRTLLNV